MLCKCPAACCAAILVDFGSQQVYCVVALAQFFDSEVWSVECVSGGVWLWERLTEMDIIDVESFMRCARMLQLH